MGVVFAVGAVTCGGENTHSLSAHKQNQLNDRRTNHPTAQDTTHGAIVAQHRTRLGPCSVMRQNPHNAVLCLGHAAGSVTMWTPNITTPVVKMLCHRGAVTAVAVDPTGHQLVTAGERRG
jgi:hypothetical protein